MPQLKQQWPFLLGLLFKFLHFMVFNTTILVIHDNLTIVEGTDDHRECGKFFTLAEIEEILRTDAKHEYLLSETPDAIPSDATYSFIEDYTESSFLGHIENEWNNAIDDGKNRPFIVCSSLQESQGFDRAQHMSQLFPFLQRPTESRMDHNVNEALCNTEQQTCWVISITAKDMKAACQSDTHNTLKSAPLVPTVKFLGNSIESINEGEMTFLVTFPHKLSYNMIQNIKEKILQDAKNPNCTSENKTRSLREEFIQSEVQQKFPWLRTLNNHNGRRANRSLRDLKPSQEFYAEDTKNLSDLHQFNSRARMWQRALNKNSSTCDCTKALEEHKPVFEFDDENHSMEVSIRENFPLHCMLSFLAAISIQQDVGFIAVTPKINLRSMNDFDGLSYAQKLMHGDNDVDGNPWYDAGLTGRHQVVGVADTGLDYGHCHLSDRSGLDFSGMHSQADFGRRKVSYYYGQDVLDHDGGHGTFVSSIIAGKVEGSYTTTPFEGIAPEAKIAFFDISYDADNIYNGGSACCSIPPFWGKFIYRLHKAGNANIINISWGVTDISTQGQYQSFDMMFDNVVSKNPDVLIVVAAGNQGPNPGSNASPANAKNVISVGMTYTNEEQKDELVRLSARGPTDDGRIKPDVCAPGAYLIAARARPDLSLDGGVCEGDTIPAKGEETEGLKTLAGTSMAAPMVAGTAALLAQYFEEGRHRTGEVNLSEGITPRAALLKATLINIARPILSIEGENGTTEYDFNQGFGRITFDNSLPLPSNGLSAIVVNTGTIRIDEKQQEHRLKISFSKTCKQEIFSATLAWMDTPGVIGCQNCIINDLDLEIEVVKTGEIFHPNGKDKPDRKNTVERIRHRFSDEEEIFIRVKGANLLEKYQDYSLIVTGCFETLDASLDSETYSLQDSGNEDSLMVPRSNVPPGLLGTPPVMPPTNSPSHKPTATPSSNPTEKPSELPSSGPSSKPTDSPTSSPSRKPTDSPTSSPSRKPTDSPTSAPTSKPSPSPSFAPVSDPTVSPTFPPPTKSPVKPVTTMTTKSYQTLNNGQVYSSVPISTLFLGGDGSPNVSTTSTTFDSSSLPPCAQTNSCGTYVSKGSSTKETVKSTGKKKKKKKRQLKG